MKVIEKIENKIIQLEKYVDVKNDKLSTVLKYFHDEIKELEVDYGFTKKEQLSALEKAFSRKIKYTTYVDHFKKYISTKKTSQNDQKEKIQNDDLPEDNSSSILDIDTDKLKDNTGFSRVEDNEFK
jgi:uncharacterized Fe-S cluster-containing MiaB family protein